MEILFPHGVTRVSTIVRKSVKSENDFTRFVKRLSVFRTFRLAGYNFKPQISN